MKKNPLQELAELDQSIWLDYIRRDLIARAQPIAIGLVPSFVIPVAYKMIQRHLEQSGPVNILCHHAQHHELEKKLIEGSYDFGFSNRLPEMKGIKHRLIDTLEIDFYVAKKHKNTSLAKILKKLPLLVCHMDPLENSFLEQALDDAGINPIATIATDFPSILYELCCQGIGIGAFPSKVAEQISIKDLIRIKNRAISRIFQVYFMFYGRKKAKILNLSKL